MEPKDIENPIAEADFRWQIRKSFINQKINAKGNALLFYSSILPYNIMKRKYRNIEMFCPSILIPKQFVDCRH